MAAAGGAVGVRGGRPGGGSSWLEPGVGWRQLVATRDGQRRCPREPVVDSHREEEDKERE
jgi:hypothetical protein